VGSNGAVLRIEPEQRSLEHRSVRRECQFIGLPQWRELISNNLCNAKHWCQTNLAWSCPGVVVGFLTALIALAADFPDWVGLAFRPLSPRKGRASRSERCRRTSVIVGKPEGRTQSYLRMERPLQAAFLSSGKRICQVSATISNLTAEDCARERCDAACWQTGWKTGSLQPCSTRWPESMRGELSKWTSKRNLPRKMVCQKFEQGRWCSPADCYSSVLP
jgi:hypothetical protein